MKSKDTDTWLKRVVWSEMAYGIISNDCSGTTLSAVVYWYRWWMLWKWLNR